MSAAREMASFCEEEEQMVERVGGRGRGLVQALLRIRRERAWRAPQNLQATPDYWTRHQLQEVGPCRSGSGEETGRASSMGEEKMELSNSAPRTEDTNDERQQTVQKKGLRRDPGLDYRQGQGQVPPPIPRLPYGNYSPPVGCFMAPHRCPHCEDIPEDIFPLAPYSVNDSDAPPHYEDLFPPGYIPFPNPNTHLCPSMARLPTPSIPLDSTSSI